MAKANANIKNDENSQKICIYQKKALSLRQISVTFDKFLVLIAIKTNIESD